MTPSRSALCLLLVSFGPAFVRAEAPRDGDGPSARTRDAEALAGRLDAILAARREAAQIRPAAVADDAEFMRRVYLDLAGTIPPVSEVRAFLADTASDKRGRLIDRLLDGPDYVSHFTDVWRATWLPEGGAEVDNLGMRGSFEAWLRVRLRENAGYDRMVREIITAAPAPGGGGESNVDVGAVRAYGRRPGGVSPVAFYAANENKPEKLAGSTSRLFLGLRLECAQCHNHPFAEWTREQFWEFAAFFAGAPGGASAASIAIPNLNKVVQARFPDGTEPGLKKGAPPLGRLAEWATAADNKYFARAGANRVWAYFFGVGLAEPVDDLLREGGKNEMLDELAAQFAAHQFDLKFLIRAVVSTRAYQLTSAGSDPGQDDPRLFARMGVRALSTEQVVASLTEATGCQPPAGRARGPVGAALLQLELGGSFAKQQSKPTEFQTSIPQALALMNGRFVNDATALERSGTLAAVAGAPFLDTRGRVETLYLAALGRKPTAEESAKLVAYVDGGDKDQALADVFWALLNSSEFVLNH